MAFAKEIFADRLREFRQRYDLRQEDVANLADLSRRSVGLIERCQVDVRMSTFARLYRLMEIDLEMFLDGEMLWIFSRRPVNEDCFVRLVNLVFSLNEVSALVGKIRLLTNNPPGSRLKWYVLTEENKKGIPGEFLSVSTCLWPGCNDYGRVEEIILKGKEVCGEKVYGC